MQPCYFRPDPTVASILIVENFSLFQFCIALQVILSQYVVGLFSLEVAYFMQMRFIVTLRIS